MQDLRDEEVVELLDRFPEWSPALDEHEALIHDHIALRGFEIGANYCLKLDEVRLFLAALAK
jgi:hypothetical protein